MVRLFFTFIPVALMLSACTSEQKIKKPNVLIILTDDQGWGDLSIHGNDVLATPTIDAFAKSAVAFNRFYVSPVCAPTRASLLTGRYHLSTGTSWVTHRGEVMRAEETTLAELLGANGYRTGLFGKWHNGKQYPHDPIGQGFQEFFGFKEGHLNNYFDTKLIRNFTPEQTTGYVPDILTDEAIRFMQKDDPFFCLLTYNTPHAPFQVPDKYFTKYKAKGLDDRTAAIYGMVENLDDNVARLLKALRENDKENETIVIYMTDNGPNGVRFNGGFKGIKGHVDEGGVRVPFFIRYPDGSIENKTVEEYAAHIDILPTLAALTHTQVPDSLHIHGRNMLPLLTGNSTTWDDRFFFTHQVARTFDTIPGAVRSNQYLLTLYPKDTMLFDLISDPYQKQNIALNKPEIYKEYVARYVKWFGEVTSRGIDPPLIQIGYDIVPEVEFPAPDAALHGSLKFFGVQGWANDWVTNFSSEKDSAAWKFNAVKNQTYDVMLQLTSDTGTAITLMLDNQKYTFTVDTQLTAPVIPNRDRDPRTEVGEREWPEIKIASIKIPAGIHKVRVYTTTSKNMELKSIIIRKT